MQTFDRRLTAARQREAPDAHRKPRLASTFRSCWRQGGLRTGSNVPGLTREAIARLVVHPMNDRQRADFEDYLDIDAPRTAPGGVRECNLFWHHGSVGGVLRVIPPAMSPLRCLNPSQVVLDLTLASDAGGQDLVAGAAGAGGASTAFRHDRRDEHAANTLEAHHIIFALDRIDQSRGEPRQGTARNV